MKKAKIPVTAYRPVFDESGLCSEIHILKKNKISRRQKGMQKKMERITAVIPARYQSGRFPGKPLALINGKPMIQWVYEKADSVSSISQTYVAADDERVMECVRKFHGKAVMTSKAHANGTDRTAECAGILKLDDMDIVLNIQGDEPLIQEPMIEELISTVKDGDAYMGTLKERITDPEDLSNPNIVKVITDTDGNAVYFSRLPIPYNRNAAEGLAYYRHVGVYAYRAFFLKKYAELPKTCLEAAESLEQLRALGCGYKIRVRETAYSSIGVDTAEQLKLAEKMMGGGAGLLKQQERR